MNSCIVSSLNDIILSGTYHDVAGVELRPGQRESDILAGHSGRVVTAHLIGESVRQRPKMTLSLEILLSIQINFVFEFKIREISQSFAL